MVAVALAIVMFMVVAPEVNEGDAMSPTINDGQLLVVSKTSYSAKRGIPDRDKLVILEKNAKNAQNVSKDNIIARVAGLPGETVEIKDGKIYIDGDEYVTENGIKGSDGDLKVKLTKDEVFLLCDNRDKYIDSRNEKLGPVDMKEFIKDIAIALVIVIAITLIIKPTIVKESSMEPTLYENNYLFVNKLAYLTKDHPDYGDIIIFKSDIDKDDGSGKKILIKRVIAVENDVVTVSEGNVYRNGIKLDESYTLEGFTSGDIKDYAVPENEVFVMGDNRGVSLDSRSGEVGTISEDSIIGKAFFRLYPFSEIGLLK